MCRTFLIIVLTQLTVFLFADAKKNRTAIMVPQPDSDTSSLLQDARFQNGFLLTGTNTSAVRNDQFIFPFGGTPSEVRWGLAEWGSRYKLAGVKKKVHAGKIIYSNKGKCVVFERLGNSNKITMDVTASDEYTMPRRNGQDWAHLLLGQEIKDKPYLKNLEGLILQISGRLTKSVLQMKEAEFDKGLHTAQFQLFITVQDLNPVSSQYGDLFWFGIPFYDYRYKDIERYAAQDLGKADASGKFIYNMGSADFMKGSFHNGEWISIEKDIYPMLKDAVKIAKERGYLTGSAFEDLGLSSLNIGWEVPGTLDVGFEFKNFDVLKVLK